MTTRNSLVATIAAALMAVLLSMTSQPAQAAPIVWSAPQNITGDSDVDTTGTLFASANFSGANQTVNGVTFAAFTYTTGTSSQTVGNITVTGTGLVNSTYSTTSTPYGSLSTAYKALLGPLLTQTGTSNQLTFSLSNLTVGDQYTIQYWVNDPRTNGSGRTVRVGTQTLDANTTDSGGGIGQWVRGVFVADATSQNFTAASAVGSSSAVSYANAMQVRVLPVPEPSTMFLAAVGLVCADVVRRSRRRTARAC